MNSSMPSAITMFVVATLISSGLGMNPEYSSEAKSEIKSDAPPQPRITMVAKTTSEAKSKIDPESPPQPRITMVAKTTKVKLSTPPDLRTSKPIANYLIPSASREAPTSPSGAQLKKKLVEKEQGRMPAADAPQVRLPGHDTALVQTSLRSRPSRTREATAPAPAPATYLGGIMRYLFGGEATTPSQESFFGKERQEAKTALASKRSEVKELDATFKEVLAEMKALKAKLEVLREMKALEEVLQKMEALRAKLKENRPNLMAKRKERLGLEIIIEQLEVDDFSINDRVQTLREVGPVQGSVQVGSEGKAVRFQTDARGVRAVVVQFDGFVVHFEHTATLLLKNQIKKVNKDRCTEITQESLDLIAVAFADGDKSLPALPFDLVGKIFGAGTALEAGGQERPVTLEDWCTTPKNKRTRCAFTEGMCTSKCGSECSPESKGEVYRCKIGKDQVGYSRFGHVCSECKFKEGICTDSNEAGDLHEAIVLRQECQSSAYCDQEGIECRGCWRDGLTKCTCWDPSATDLSEKMFELP